MDEVSTLLTDTDDHHVDYEWVQQGQELVFVRTVWTKRYRRTDRTMVHEETVARLGLPRVPGMVQDIVGLLVTHDDH